MTKTCGTCRYFKPGEKAQIGSLLTRTEESWCMMLNKIRYAEEKPVSWCWVEAASEQLASRVKAGLIGGDDVNG